MELPLTSALSTPQMLYPRYHGKRTAFAYGTYFPYWCRQEFPGLLNCPDSACLELLQSRDGKIPLLNREALPEGSQLEVAMDQTEELNRLVKFDWMIAYQIWIQGESE
jgi:hypothetical protein